MLVLTALWLSVQVLVPLRHLAYPGDVLLTQEGTRWSWRVMVAERAAVAEMWVIDDEGRSSVVDLSRLLTPLQLRMVATEPDLLLQLAHHLRDEHRARGEEVEVHAEVWSSVNGRPPYRLVDPSIDLSGEAPSLLGHEWLRHVHTSDEPATVAIAGE